MSERFQEVSFSLASVWDKEVQIIDYHSQWLWFFQREDQRELCGWSVVEAEMHNVFGDEPTKIQQGEWDPEEGKGKKIA